MEQSKNYNFNLPSKNDETSADVDLISDNFRTVDDVVKRVQDDVSKMPTNLVNGSAEGSLRGIAAKAEDSDYTMGEYAVALGYKTTASGNYSYAEGFFSTASGSYSHAEGTGTASGDCSHSEGISTASGGCSHSEGNGTESSGHSSHAEGQNTVASGYASHAEGQNAVASDTGSHAEGENTIASSSYQHVQGRYNIKDESGKYAHIVGNGSFYYGSAHRSNAHTLDWDGNAWFAGDVYVGGTSQDDDNATKLSSVATDITQVKEKLDGIEEGANKTIVDSELSDTSTNPVQNKVVSAKIKNHASFSVLTTDANEKTYIKIGKFTGNGAGGRAIFTINGKVGWNNKNDGGLKILTLSSNDCRDATSTDIWTGGSMFDFGQSDNDGTTIIEGTPDIQIALVRPIGYSVKEVDVYLKFVKNKYNSYLFTVDFTDGCNWETDIKSILTTDPDPMETALSAFVVPKKRFAGVESLEKKVYLTNGTIYGAVDWNTITKTGCYKIQNCTMTADYNAPVDEYRFGVLQVLNSEWETGTSADEHRVVQIYIPHRHMLKYGIHIRSNNSATGYNGWSDWVGFYSAKQVDLKLETKASVETGICTLTVSNGSVSNASYSKTGKDVTVNFWFYPDDTNEVVVSGLPYVATKNQSGIASASVGGVRVSYEMSKDNANATLYPETTSEQYCTLTYNLGAYNPQP